MLLTKTNGYGTVVAVELGGGSDHRMSSADTWMDGLAECRIKRTPDIMPPDIAPPYITFPDITIRFSSLGQNAPEHNCLIVLTNSIVEMSSQ